MAANSGEGVQQRKAKKGILNKISELSFQGEGKMAKSPVNTKSIYMGADIKLDAFDCFHNVLNECVCDYTFSIADAALILKQFTSDIIKKIVPMISQHHSPNKKPKVVDSTEYYEESAIDLEVSELTDEKKEKLKGLNKRKPGIKRPDASRPTRMLSPGSNSCSPVSAAVHALISISAPVIDGTITKTVVQARSQTVSTKSSTVSKTKNNRKDVKNDSSVFMPVSKPSVSSEFTDSLFTPVPKQAITTSSNTKDYGALTAANAQNEFPEVFVVSKVDGGVGESQGFMIPSSLLDSISTHSAIMPDISTITSHLGQGVMSTNTIRMASDHILHAKQSELMQHAVNKSLGSDDPLPNFNLFSSTGLVSELSCGLPSPFQNPGSPITAQTPPHLQQQQHNQLHKQHLLQKHHQQQLEQQQQQQQQQHRQQDATHQSQAQTLIQPTSCISSASLVQAIKNVKSGSEHGSTDQSLQPATTDQSQNGNVTQTTLVQLRTILPKPYETTAGSLSIVPVIPASIVSTGSQLSPVIKLDDRKPVQYSVPPSQIFTKLNPTQLPNISLASITSVGPTRPALSNTCFFPQQNSDNIFQGQYSQKELKQFLSASASNLSLCNAVDMKSNQTTPVSLHSQTATQTFKKPENTGGHLEVASALLSMGTEPDEVSKTSLDDFKILQQCIQNSLKDELGTIPVMFGENGSFKIDDVDIDPRKHKIGDNHFECGNCNHVFTSVLYLARHIKRVCPDMSQRKWKCTQCTKAFRHPFGLQQHMYTHTGERPHKCTQCPKAFYSANDLRRHIRTHSGEKPYQCQQCEKWFSTTISLRTHNYIHTGERPHKCSLCSKTFATSSKLSRHVVTHSDKRPFPCNQCTKTFNRSGDLRRHYSSHHGESHELLSCDQCHKGFATQKALSTHKLSHKRDQLQAVQNQQWL